MIKAKLLCPIIIFFCVLGLRAQEFIPLYPEGKMPNSKGMKLELEIREERIYQVGTPGIHAFFPAPEKNTGVAILIIPGGGYARIAHQNARTNVAKWLNSNGISAFALDYRLPHSPDLVQKELAPLQDAQQAIKVIRANAKKWNINAEKIGVMGTSAGGHAASFIGTTSEELVKIGHETDNFSSVPNFMILVSPVITMGEFAHSGSKKNLLGENPVGELIEKFSTEKHVSAKTPPTFLMLASDDQSVNPKNSLLFYTALLENKVSASLHIFPLGGHSIPIKNGPGSSASWTYICELWLSEIGMLPLKK